MIAPATSSSIVDEPQESLDLSSIVNSKYEARKLENNLQNSKIGEYRIILHREDQKEAQTFEKLSRLPKSFRTRDNISTNHRSSDGHPKANREKGNVVAIVPTVVVPVTVAVVAGILKCFRVDKRFWEWHDSRNAHRTTHPDTSEVNEAQGKWPSYIQCFRVWLVW